MTPSTLLHPLTMRYYRDCTHPGGYFCRSMDYLPMPYYPNIAIVIIHHRYDC